MKWLILFLLLPSLAMAGQGMGPGPGVKAYSAGGGGGSIAFPVATTSDYTTTTADTEMSVPVPTGTESGDCIVFIGTSGGRTISPPAGVTQLATSTVYADTYAWYRKAGASESAYAFTTSGNYAYASVMAIRITGAVCESTSDFTVTNGNSASSADVAVCANITMPDTNMAVLWSEVGDAGFTSNSNNRGGATERGDMTGGTTGSHISIWSEAIASAGSVTGAQITRSGWSAYNGFSIGVKTQP